MQGRLATPPLHSLQVLWQLFRPGTGIPSASYMAKPVRPFDTDQTACILRPEAA